jgi:hypothetical protein
VGENKTCSITNDDVAPTSKIAPTQTTCEQYRDGLAEDLTELFYNPNKGKIQSVAPGVMFYYSTLTASGPSLSVKVDQKSSDPSWPDLAIQDTGQVILWDATCTKVHTVDVTDGGNPILSATGLTPGATYYLSVKYVPSSLRGTPVQEIAGEYPQVDYSFVTSLNGQEITSSWDSVTIISKK